MSRAAPLVGQGVERWLVSAVHGLRRGGKGSQTFAAYRRQTGAHLEEAVDVGHGVAVAALGTHPIELPTQHGQAWRPPLAAGQFRAW